MIAVNPTLVAGVVGWITTAVLFGLWQNAREAVIEEREGCNADKLEAALTSERQARRALTEAAAARERELQDQIEAEARAAEIARQAAADAASRPETVRTVIREVATANACISTDMPEQLVDSVFDGTGHP